MKLVYLAQWGSLKGGDAHFPGKQYMETDLVNPKKRSRYTFPSGNKRFICFSLNNCTSLTLSMAAALSLHFG